MKQNILGVIGGLGPETGCNFCLNVNNKFKPLTKRQPHILLDNLPISQEAESRLINGGPSQEHLDLLIESVQRMNKLDADVIVIACNTVHTFIDKLRKNSTVPILSILEETVKVCKKLNFKKVGLLASTTTIQGKLHSNQLGKNGIKTITPEKNDQMFISECIVKIINNKTDEIDKKKVNDIMEKLRRKGAEALILGCTDLPLLIKEDESLLHLVDTCSVLEDAAVKVLQLESAST